MSLETKGLKCAVCHAYLFEDDDVVYCPECGAPHHRECYRSLGHCGLQSLHGTDMQYDRAEARRAEQEAEKEQREAERREQQTRREQPFAAGPQAPAVRCRACGSEYPGSEPRCPHCGAPNIGAQGIFFDPLGGVPADMELAENVTAADAGKFVQSNTRHYIPRFAAMTSGKKLSWNWAAFLLPGGWLLSRKMYLAGVLTGLLSVAVSLLMLPLNYAVLSMGTFEGMTDYALMQAILDNLPSIGRGPIIAAAISMLLGLVLRCVVAAVGDSLYRGHTVSAIQRIKSESGDIELDYRRRGGLSLLALTLGFFAIEYLPSIIAMFIL